MGEYLSQKFYGNSIQEWLVALLIVIGSFLLAKIIFWVINKFVKRATKKSKTKLDDILVDMLEEPLVFAVVIAGFWFGFKTLDFSTYNGTREWFTKVFHVLIAINVGWLISRVLDALIKEYLAPVVQKTEGDLDDQLLPIIRKGMKLIVWTIAIIVGLNNAGYDVAAILAGLGIGGLAFALAAQDTVSNFFGGFMIFVDKPFTIKDRIKISGYDGTVEEVGIRSTRIRTLDGRVLTVPNSNFTKNIIENVSSEPKRKVVLSLGLTYDTTPQNIELALNILKEIADTNESVDETVPHGFTGFGDFSLNLLFIYYIKKGEDILGTQTAVNMEILRRFNEAGLEFAFPTQTIITQNGGQANEIN